jgi:hypothetical protein
MCRIALNVYNKQSSSEQKLQMRPEFHIHSKPSEYTKPVFTPKYEYVEVGQLIINPDSFENSEIILSKQSASSAPSADSTSLVTEPSNESKYRSNIQNAIEFSQYGNKQHTSRIIITEPMLENIMKIPIVVRRVVNKPSNSHSHSQSQSSSMTYIPQTETYSFDGEDHYLTTYSKNTKYGLHDDEKYETHLPSIKPIKSKTTYDILKNTFLNKIMTRFTGANSIRRAYKHIDYSGKGVITKNDLKISLNMLGIYLITDDDFNLLYFELAGQPNKMITYLGFKNYIDKNM